MYCFYLIRNRATFMWYFYEIDFSLSQGWNSAESRLTWSNKCSFYWLSMDGLLSKQHLSGLLAGEFHQPAAFCFAAHQCMASSSESMCPGLQDSERRLGYGNVGMSQVMVERSNRKENDMGKAPWKTSRSFYIFLRRVLETLSFQSSWDLCAVLHCWLCGLLGRINCCC